MCKSYINDKVEQQIRLAQLSLDLIENIKDLDNKRFPSVRETRRQVLSARAHMGVALKYMGQLERVRYADKVEA